MHAHLAGALRPASVADDHAGVGAGVVTGHAGQLERGRRAVAGLFKVGAVGEQFVVPENEQSQRIGFSA